MPAVLARELLLRELLLSLVDSAGRVRRCERRLVCAAYGRGCGVRAAVR